jgi:hypothetical protein
MATEIVFACEDFTPLVGKTIDAFFHEDGYWRFFVALRTAEKEELVFTTEERGIAKYFEVFPIKFAVESEQARTWVPLEKPFTIKSVARLWRNEWLEPVEDNGKFLGSGPHHVHHAGSSLAGPSAVASVKVLAGVQLTDTQGQSIVVSASDSAPCNVNIAVGGAVRNVLEGYFYEAL